MKKRKIKFTLTNKNDKVKREIKEMLDHLGISKSYFKKTMPTVSGSQTDFIRKSPQQGGHKPNLYQQKQLLMQLIAADKKLREDMESQKEMIKEDQATKSAMKEQAGEVVDKKELKGLVSSVFNRDR